MDTSDFFQLNMEQANIVFVKKDKSKSKLSDYDDGESKSIIELINDIEESLT